MTLAERCSKGKSKSPDLWRAAELITHPPTKNPIGKGVSFVFAVIAIPIGLDVLL